jgi:hypothetical protein
MGITTGQIEFTRNLNKFKKEEKPHMLNMNGVGVLESSHYYLKGKENFPTTLEGTAFSNGIGDQVSLCFVKFPRKKDREARSACEKAFNDGKNSESALTAGNQQLQMAAIEASKVGVWTPLQIGLIAISTLAAVTGMVLVIKKFAK